MLEHLGKDPKDTRYLDRAVSKWIIWKDVDTWGYILCTEYIEELEEELVRYKIRAWEMPWYVLTEDIENGRVVPVDNVKSSEPEQKVDKNDNLELTNLEWELKEEKKKNSELFDAYMKALKRINTKNDFMDKLIIKLKKIVDPKWFRNDWDFYSEVYSELNYDPKDDNYL